jgi:DNA-binding NarL/FixJ family response regulator
LRVLVCAPPGLERRRITVGFEAHDDIEVVGESDHAEQGIGDARRLLPDVVVIDGDLPRIGALRAAASLREVSPTSRVLVLVPDDDPFDAFRALRAGATGFVDRRRLGHLPDAARALRQGRVVLTPEAAEGLLARAAPRPSTSVPPPEIGPLAPPRPTATEAEVVRQLAAGAGYPAAAAAAGTSVEASVGLVANLVARLQQSARAEAVMYTVAPRIFS